MNTQKYFNITILTLSQQNVLTPEIITSIKPVGEVQLLPDEKQIVFQISRLRRDDEKPGAPWAEIWMVKTTGGEPYRFTFSDKSDRTPRWSPNGMSIAFLSTRGEGEKAH